MNTDKGKNINNAFAVVFDTYKNVSKLMEKITLIASEEREMSFLLPSRFIRYKSDPDIKGWAVSYFMLPFRKHNDKDNIYLVEITFDYELNDDKENKGPQIGLSKFSYNNLPEVIDFLSSNSYGFFTAPLYNEKFVEYEENNQGTRFVSKKINTELADKNYGLNSVKAIYIPLVDVRSDNIEEKIFDTFDELDLMTQV